MRCSQGETAEQLEAKQQSSMQKDEYRLHSVVLASGSGYFKQRLLSRASTEAPIPPLRQPAATNAHSQANQCSDEGDEEDQAPAQPGTTMESQPRCVPLTSSDSMLPATALQMGWLRGQGQMQQGYSHSNAGP